MKPPRSPRSLPPEGAAGRLGSGPASAGWPLLPLLTLLVFAALPAFASPYVVDLALRIAVYAIFTLSLELLVGQAGLVSLGHAAFLGIGAYATVLGSGDAGGSAWWLAPLAVGAAALYAAVVGALCLRTRGVYFIMVTLAFAQMAYFVVHDTKAGGGSDGIFLYVKPVLELGAGFALDLADRRTFFYVALGVLVLVYAFLSLLRRSRFGHALAGLRVNEQRMRAAGYPTYLYKLAAFVVAGAIAGLAGFLLASKDGAVNPELLAWQESGAVLLMLILGGVGSLRGAVIGAAAFTLLREAFQSESLFGSLASHWQLTLGLAIIAFVALLPNGLVGLGRWRARRAATAAHG